MALRFHDRHGEFVSFERVQEIFENDEVSMASDIVADTYWVSTMVCPLAQEQERWFETAIFVHGGDERMLIMQNASTETSALQNHADAVEHLQKFVDQGIDFAGLMDYVNGDRPDLPDGCLHD